ncbi:hypothetical protein TRIUR3_19657 [Triticum urartu]|uniref:Uncharacterized protein n=1 Tax=Triticum urartu TaxID=4572 RepID=M7YSW5_TRIUA|nr:hypothetical protein TRIUR3_19657 [Triticum urartu]
MDNDAGMIPSSPSAESSSSSSDIDTESTCSFFRDRSTTLGTLMGVSLADGEDRPPETQQAADEQERPRAPAPGEEGWTWCRRWRPRRGASWWRLCRDDVGGTTSLAHFLHMERQLSGDGGGGLPGGRCRWGGCRCCSPASAAAELEWNCGNGSRLDCL